VLIDDARDARYAPTGHLVYLRGLTLMAAPFDLRRLAITGPAVAMVDGLNTHFSFSNSLYAFSSTGTLAYLPAIEEKTELLGVDRHGVSRLLTSEQRVFDTARFSPDGQRLALMLADPAVLLDGVSPHDIWILDISRNTLSRLTADGKSDDPIWTPDGKSITYLSRKDGGRTLLSRSLETGSETVLLRGDGLGVPWSWSADGRTLLFQRRVGQDKNVFGSALWVLGPDGQARAFSATSADAVDAGFSPDGKWIAYTSRETGRDEVYVQPFPGPGRRWQVSSNGGNTPRWGRGGREVIFRLSDRKRFMTAAVTYQPSFAIGKPTLLFDVQGTLTFDYDISPDGETFAVTNSVQSNMATRVNIVENWFEELKTRVPTK
jgi:serine/threonine-protein kinase